MPRSLLPLLNVTLKIETMSGNKGTSIKLIGRLRAQALQDLEAEIRASARVIALEIDEVTLVDVQVVRFLKTCETQGIRLRGFIYAEFVEQHFPDFLREVGKKLSAYYL